MATVNPDYLIKQLRLEIGDTEPTTYRYTSEWLTVAIFASIRALSKWWRTKYIVDEANDVVYRNPNIFFDFNEPPVILQGDEEIIVLMASLIVLEGGLESMAWNVGSWKDNEVSYSNIESGKIRDGRVSRIWDRLISYIKPPIKQLAWTRKQSLPGYKAGNGYESSGDY